MAASVDTADLKKAIKNILKDADLDSLSAKKVRRKLEERFGIDLTERKKEIDELTMKMITEGVNCEETTKSKDNGRVMQNGSEKKDESDEDKNDSDSSFDEPDPVPVIKKRKVQKPAPKPKKPTSDSVVSDDDDEVDDEELAKQLQQEEDMNLRTRRRPQKKPPAPRKPKEKRERKAGTSMYSRPCQLSPELAAVVGQDQVSRHEIVKRMWEVMRERDLQDPKNKQFMICDEELQKIFGRKRVRMFGMMKWLTKHIRSIEDLVE